MLNIISVVMLSIPRLGVKNFALNWTFLAPLGSLLTIILFSAPTIQYGDSGFFHQNLESVINNGAPLYSPAIYQSGVLTSLLLWKSVELGVAIWVPPFIGITLLALLTAIHRKLVNLSFKLAIWDASLIMLSVSSLFTFTKGYLEIYTLSSALTALLMYVSFASLHADLSNRNREFTYFLIGILSCLAIFSHLANIPFVILSIFLAAYKKNKKKDLGLLCLGLSISLIGVLSLINVSNYPIIEANIKGGSDGQFLGEFSTLKKNFTYSLLISLMICFLPIVCIVVMKLSKLDVRRFSILALTAVISVYISFEFLYGFDLGPLDLDLRLLPAFGLSSASLWLISYLRENQIIGNRKVLLLLTMMTIVNIVFQMEIVGLSVQFIQN